MTIKINSKIISYEVKKEEENKPKFEIVETEKSTSLANDLPKIAQMHEDIPRPEMLLGSTYKVKTPLSEHALYVTVNDFILNEDTEQEQRRPYEIFINSKNMEHFQWIVALTRVISAVFRKGGDSTFLVEELKSVFDPQGGYFKPGGKFMPSIIAELGTVIESHMKLIGMIKNELDEHQQKLIFDKKKQLEQATKLEFTPEPNNNEVFDFSNKSIKSDVNLISDDESNSTSQSEYPANARLCNKCHNKSVIVMDGCATCLNCGDSKCG